MPFKPSDMYAVLYHVLVGTCHCLLAQYDIRFVIILLACNPGGYFHIRWWWGGAWPQDLPLKFLLEPQLLPPKI